MSFFAEIRRRKVFQVAVVYAVVAWLIVQVVSTIEQPLNLPEWFATVVIVSLAIGFPVALILAWAFDVTPEGLRATTQKPFSSSAEPRSANRLNFLMQGLVLLAVGFLVADQYLFPLAVSPVPTRGPAPQLSRPVHRFSLELGPTTPLSNTALNTHVALSPDGRRIAFAVNTGSNSQLFVRELDQSESRPVLDSAGAQHPFFSPDGDSVAFFADGTDNKLKRAPFRGGPAQALADITGAGGGYWDVDGNIVFSTGLDGIRSLLRVPATGGTPEYVVPPPERRAEGYVWPAALPGDDAMLFVLRPANNGPIQDGNIALLSLETGEYRVLIRGAHRPQYVPTGHIVFVRSGALWAVPFDSTILAITGPEVPIIDDVQQNDNIGGAVYAFSNDGLLVYLAGSESSAAFAPKELVWVDREGREVSLGIESRPYFSPQLSPDGQRLAVVVRSPTAGTDIWINDLARNTLSRLTLDSSEQDPLWTPDGNRVIFWSGNGYGGGAIRSLAANGTGQPRTLTTADTAYLTPMAVVPNGEALIFQRDTLGVVGGLSAYDLGLLSLRDDANSRELIATNAGECCASLSRDGRWIAYGSNETGQFEIYVRPFPNIEDGKWQISDGGGTQPRWRADGLELFFRSAGATWAVPIDYAEGFEPGTPIELFTGEYWERIESYPTYDVTPDGQRFLMMKALGEEETQSYSRQTSLTTIENWFTELSQLAPPVESD